MAASGAGIGLACAAVALGLWYTGCLDVFERKTWDLRVRSLCRKGEASDRIRIVLIDQNSLDWAHAARKWKWEWPREVYAALVQYMKDSGAKIIVMDLLYGDSSDYGVDDDAKLGTVFHSASNVVLSMALGRESGVTKQWPAGFPVSLVSLEESVARLVSVKEGRDRFDYPGATMPIPDLATNVAALGDVMLNPDADGIYRRVSLFRIFDGQVVPSLGLAAFAVAEGGARLGVRRGCFTVNGRDVPVDDEGYATLNFRGPSQTHQTVGAQWILESVLLKMEGKPERMPKDFLKDCYVFVGCSAFGLYDLRQSSVGGLYPGVELHATMLDNLLSGDFFRLPRVGTTALFVVLFGVLCGVILVFSAGAVRSVILLAMCLLAPVAASVFFYRQNVNMPLLVYEVAGLAASLGAIIFNYAVEGRQRRFLRKAFQQYISPHVIDQIVGDPSRLDLGGQMKELSIMFADTKGFTTISEALGPKNTTALLNEFLTEMTAIILKENGTIDKYIGDCIVAFWNAPLDQADHPCLAVRAALRCQLRLAEIRGRLRDKYGVDVYVRAAIATGQVFVGNMGSVQRFDYTFIGDTGNLSSRLEGVNKEFGTHLLISEETRKRLTDECAVREIGSVKVVGRVEPVRIFEVMTPEDYATRKDAIESFATGLEAYRAGRFAEAAGIFKANADTDPPSASYMRRCLELAANPPAKWEGVWEMTHK